MSEINREYQASTFYEQKSWINVYYYVYMALEEWVSKHIFRNDLSRVFLASDEYVFRRRFELMDSSEDYDKINASSLQFPFANYSPQQVGWIPDDTIAMKQASFIYKGVYEGSTLVKAAPSTITIPMTFYFSREDDARFCYETLYFYMFNEHYYTISVPYGRYSYYDTGEKVDNTNTLGIPINFRLGDLQFNPQFKETDWLKNNRIFTIKINFTLRTFVIEPPKQPDYQYSVNDNGQLIDENNQVVIDNTTQEPMNYNDGIQYYNLVDDVILNVFTNTSRTLNYNAGYDEESQTYKGNDKFPETGTPNTFYVDVYKDENHQPLKPNIYVWSDNHYQNIKSNSSLLHQFFDIDIDSMRLNGTITENTIKLNYLRVNDISYTTAKLEWKYSDTFDTSDISKIELLYGNETITLDSTATEYKFNKLTQNSTYNITLKIYTNSNLTKSFYKEFTTLKRESKSKKSDGASIIGTEW